MANTDNADLSEALAWRQQNSGNAGEQRSLDVAQALPGAGASGALKRDDAKPGSDVRGGSSDGASAAQGAQGEKAEGLQAHQETANSPLYTKALEALQRGLPKSIRESTIKGMTREQVFEVGLEMAERQAERDKLGNELEALKKAKDGQNEDGGARTAPAAPSQGKVDAVDLSELLAPFDLDLDNEDLPKALTAVAEHTLTAARNEFRRELGELSELRETVKELREGEVSRQLEKRFPELRDQSIRADILKRAAKYEKVPDFEYSPGAGPMQRFIERVQTACELALGTSGSTGNFATPDQRPQPPGPSGRAVQQTTEKDEVQSAKDFMRTHRATNGDVGAALRASLG